jgi:superoxide reductase
MTEKLEIYKCHICGHVVQVLLAGAGELVCCGKPMEELVAGSVEASIEKHIPVFSVDGNKIFVKEC